jgi:putative ABC transport system permease protein
MRPADLLRLSLTALWQQKVRTGLTLLGVVIGTYVLVLSLSVGAGVQVVAMQEFRRHDQLRKVEARAGFEEPESRIPHEELAIHGAMSDAKRQRLREALARRWSFKGGARPRTPLTRDRIRELEELPHVERATPNIARQAWALFDGTSEQVQTVGASSASRHYRGRVVAGEMFGSDDGRGVLVGEFLLYRLGIADDADVEGVIGKKLRLEYRGRNYWAPGMLLTFLNQGLPVSVDLEEQRVLEKVLHQLPAAADKFNLTPAEHDVLMRVLGRAPTRPGPAPSPNVVIDEEFTIVGVLREWTREDEATGWFADYLARQAEVVIPVRAAEEVFFRNPANADSGVDSVTLTVDAEENVQGVADAVKEMHLNQFSLAEIAKRVRFNVLLITFAMGFVAGVALLVAALGITNTMVMSVLERTREIGVMKAVGARDGAIQLVFLVEGALIGLVGGALGLLGGWLTSIPGESAARALVEKQGEIKLQESLFIFPWWLTLGVPLFAVAITTLAALYPARRAARVNPIQALRHE